MPGTALTNPRVLALLGGKEINDVYRIMLPFHFAGYEWVGLEQASEVPADYDLYVLSRVAPRLPGVAEEIGKIGKIVWDTDDELTMLHRNAEDIIYANFMEELLGYCVAITSTTPYLAKLYGERYGKPYHVLPNCLQPSFWADRERENDTLTIGVCGGSSHYADWRLVDDALRRVAREFPVKITVGGYLPDYLDRKGITYIPWGPYEDLPDMVRQFDIGLCPLPKTEFNMCKSGIKALEYMASARDVQGKQGGVAVLASNMPVYRRVVNNKSNGLLVNDDEWYEAIKTVIEDEFLRWKLQQRGLQWVKKHRNVENEAQRWVKFYRKVVRGGL